MVDNKHAQERAQDRKRIRKLEADTKRLEADAKKLEADWQFFHAAIGTSDRQVAEWEQNQRVLLGIHWTKPVGLFCC